MCASLETCLSTCPFHEQSELDSGAGSTPPPWIRLGSLPTAATSQSSTRLSGAMRQTRVRQEMRFDLATSPSLEARTTPAREPGVPGVKRHTSTPSTAASTVRGATSSAGCWQTSRGWSPPVYTLRNT